MRPGVLLILFLLCVSAASAQALFNEQGYRIDSYRRATPDVAPAGRLLTTPELQRLIESSNPVLLDVQAVTLRPETREFGQAWLPSRPRWHIAGSTWLPNVGYGELDEGMAEYFRANLRRLTRGDRDRALVLYCVVDCWMSWNAVRRAASLGYRNLYWYPEGSDGWEQAGLPLVEATPYPLEGIEGDHFFVNQHPLSMARQAQRAAESGRNLLLFFETDSCPFCKRMRNTVLLDREVIAESNTAFIALSINIDSEQPMGDFAGEIIAKSSFARRYRVARTPTMVFVDAQASPLHRHSGLIATADEMKKLLNFVSSRAYDDMSWRQYKRR